MYKDQNRFLEGSMADACEALDAILRLIHLVNVNAPDVFHADAAICEPLCAAHSIFGLAYIDQWRCPSCLATSEVSVYSDFMYRIYVTEAAELIHKYKVQKLLSRHSFNRLILLLSGITSR